MINLKKKKLIINNEWEDIFNLGCESEHQETKENLKDKNFKEDKITLGAKIF